MATKFDAVAGSELRDIQGEVLDVKGADISELTAGRGIVNDNHSNKLPDIIGRITDAKKIFKVEDCENDRQKYFWNKIKAPYIYVSGELFDDEDHRSAKAAAAILKHQHRTDSPLKLKCSVEGGIIERGKKDERILARTKIRGLALTFTPANNATLVEGLGLAKSTGSAAEEMELIKSLVPTAITDVPTLVDFSHSISIAKIRKNIENIHEVVCALKKNISLAEPLEKASKKQLLQQLGSDPQAAEIADWLSKDIKRDDVQQWFLRNYKKDPKIWNSQNKEAVQHYVGTAEINSDHDIGKIRFDKSHSFDDGIKLWKDAEESLKNKKKNSSNLLKPDDKTKKLIDLGNGWGWYDLGKGYDADEGEKMSHCGNANAKQAEGDEEDPHHGDRILSLRKEHNIDGETYHEPRLSFIENNGYIGESKGFANSKPAEKYHDAIVQLLKHPRIKENVGGGYNPNNNFYLNDLSKDKLDKLLEDKPNIEKLWKLSSGKIDQDQYPKKHLEDAMAHNKALQYLKDNKPHISQARFRDIDPTYAKGLIADFINNKEPIDDYGDYIDHDSYEQSILSMLQSPHLDKSHVDLAFDKGKKEKLERLLSSHAATKDHVSRALTDEDPGVRRAAANSPRFGKEHMPQALTDEDPGVRRAAVESPHFGEEDFDQAFNDEDPGVRRAAVESPHFGEEHVPQALADEDGWVRESAVASPRFRKEHMPQALTDEDPGVRYQAVLSPHFGEEHVPQALADEDPGVRRAAVESPRFRKEHMPQALTDEDPGVRRAAVESPHFGEEHVPQALADEDPAVRRAAMHSSHFDMGDVDDGVVQDHLNLGALETAMQSSGFFEGHMDKALSNKIPPRIRQAAVLSPHFGEEHVPQALADEDPWVRAAAVKSPRFRKEHMPQAFADEDHLVRAEAVKSPHFGEEDFDQAFNDEDPWVRAAAVKSPYFRKEHAPQALTDKDPGVRRAAVESPHFGEEDFDQAFNDKDPVVRGAAIRSPHFGTQHVPQALADEDGWVRESAKDTPQYQTYLKQKGLAKTTRAQILKKDAAVKQDHERIEAKILSNLNKIRSLTKALVIESGKTQVLNKGAMRRLAPRPRPREVLFAQDAYSPTNDASMIKRNQMELLTQIIASKNPHALKNIDGKIHVLLHRGMDPNNKSSALPMNISSDGSLSHANYGMYTDDYSYAKSFTGHGDSDGKVHSVWVPIGNVNTNAQFERKAIQAEQRANPEKHGLDPDSVDDYHEAYDEILSRGNHILVNPGSYRHATEKELNNYLNFEPEESKVREPALGSMNLREGSSTGEGHAIYKKWQGSDPRHIIKLFDEDDPYAFTTRAGVNPYDMGVGEDGSGHIGQFTAGVSDIGYDRVETGKPVRLNDLKQRGLIKNTNASNERDLKYATLDKALTAGYGGAGSPTNLTGGGVMQTESVDMDSFKHIECPECGKDQPYVKYQVKCRSCNKHFPFDTLAKFFTK